jgi:hypothetical protein
MSDVPLYLSLLLAPSTLPTQRATKKNLIGYQPHTQEVDAYHQPSRTDQIVDFQTYNSPYRHPRTGVSDLKLTKSWCIINFWEQTEITGFGPPVGVGGTQAPLRGPGPGRARLGPLG